MTVGNLCSGFPRRVGVAPGTTTLQLGSVPVWMPYGKGFVDLRELRGVDTSARIRWDLIGLVGGAALVISMTAGLFASALGRP